MCVLLVTPARAVMVMPLLNAAEARERTDLAFHVWHDADGHAQAVAAALRDLGPDGRASRIALDPTMRADAALCLAEATGASSIVTTDATLGRLRSIKSPQEVELLQRSAAVADAVMSLALNLLAEGVTEQGLAASIRDGFGRHGAMPDFEMVAFGRATAFPHHHPQAAALAEGDAILLDLGGSLDGYRSDITRMAILGEGPPGYRDRHDLVEAALQAGLSACRAGATFSDIDRAARCVIEEAGWGGHFTCRAGHGLGLELHEAPHVVAGNDQPVEEGMVFTIEPGIYDPESFGLRLEEVVVMQADGPRCLSTLPRGVHEVAKRDGGP
jgi:Xaa-Pro aminopeptidase